MFYYISNKIGEGITKHNLKLENQVSLLITGSKMWHYFVVKGISALSREITTKHIDYYCINCNHSFSTKNKIKSHEIVCKYYDFCYVLQENGNMVK